MLRQHIAILCFLLPLPLLAADLSLDVRASREQLYLGESFHLTVKVSGSRRPPKPDLSGIADVRIRSLGARSENRQSIVIVNGRVQRTGFVGRTYTYELTPLKKGRLRAGPIVLHAQAGELTAPGPVITVAGIEAQDSVLISVTTSRDTVLVDEPFLVTLALRLKRLHAPYDAAEPLDPNEPPLLVVPYLQPKPIAGLDGPDVTRLLQGLLTQSRTEPAFRLNDYSLQANPLSDFFGGSAARFNFERQARTYDEADYFEYTLRTEYIPREEGSYTFGPVTFKGKVFVDVDASGNGISTPVFAVGSACTVRVVPPPEEGRPASYIGAIGTNMQVSASLDTQTCTVGDPLKLTLTVAGGVSLHNLTIPDLAAQDSLTQLFRVYYDTVQVVTHDDRREFVYTVRPIRHGTLEIPPIEVAYYDAEQRSYRILKTAAIPLRVNEGVHIAEETILNTATNLQLAQSDLHKGQSLVTAPFTMTESGAIPSPLAAAPFQWLIGLAGPGIFGLVILIRHTTERLSRNRNLRRRRMAAVRAASRLRPSAPDPSKAIFDAMAQYLVDRVSPDTHAITPGDVPRILKGLSVPDELLNHYATLMERAFNATFAAASGADAVSKEDLARARDLIHQLDGIIGSVAEQ